MTENVLLDRLQSASMETRIRATYELNYGDFSDLQILTAVRENLGSVDPDLLDITIMGLLVRGKDIHSSERVWAILESTRDDLVFSSAMLVLSSLARTFPETAATTLQNLEVLPRSHLAADNLVLLDDTLAGLRQLAA